MTLGDFCGSCYVNTHTQNNCGHDWKRLNGPQEIDTLVLMIKNECHRNKRELQSNAATMQKKNNNKGVN